MLANRVKVSTSTQGAGPITLGSADAGFYDFAGAGILNGDTVRYVIENGNNFEIGTGIYTSSGTTLSRIASQTLVSETPGTTTAITLSGSSTVFVTAISNDFRLRTALTLIYGL